MKIDPEKLFDVLVDEATRHSSLADQCEKKGDARGEVAFTVASILLTSLAKALHESSV